MASVYFDFVNSELSGYVWSPYAGWLSFNDEGCPSGYSDCRAKVLGAATDPVRPLGGFARFISDGAAGLDQWVSLSKKGSEPDYGLYYSTSSEGTATVGVLRGFAWGSGPALGWISFGGPVLKNVVQQANGTFNVTYENPIPYSRVEIYYKKETDSTFRRFEPGISLPATQAQHTVQNLSIPVEVNTKYQFKVRGILP